MAKLLQRTASGASPVALHTERPSSSSIPERLEALLNARPDSIDLLEVDAAVLDAMARQLAVLIENMMLRQELENHVDELVALYRASHLIVTGHEEEDALEVMLKIVAQALAASSASI